MKATSPEIFCTLTEPELRQRKLEVRESLGPHVLASSYADGVSELVFARPAVSRERLEHLIMLEQTCCPFFEFDLRQADKTFTLVISGPKGSESFVRDLFSPQPSASCGCSGQCSKEDRC
ncbi:MAG: hypothetical protein AAGF53_18895 [Pseudomonadota bacterium]